MTFKFSRRTQLWWGKHILIPIILAKASGLRVAVGWLDRLRKYEAHFIYAPSIESFYLSCELWYPYFIAVYIYMPPVLVYILQ